MNGTEAAVDRMLHTLTLLGSIRKCGVPASERIATQVAEYLLIGGRMLQIPETLMSGHETFGIAPTVAVDVDRGPHQHDF